MRKSRVLIFLTLLCILVLVATGLFACKKKPVVNPEEGRVVAVATAMDTVYAAMIASDGSKSTNFFTLKTQGSYQSGETIYDYTIGGTFDVTQNNRDDDKRSQLLVEIKNGSIEVFTMYYSEGKLYVDFPPYARRGLISDFNLAEVVHAVAKEKDSGVIKAAADTLPMLASRVFTSCRSFSEEAGDRYVFTLSYTRLFDAFGAIVESWDAGFSPEELLSALHLTETDTAALIADAPETTVEFTVKDGAFISAKAAAGSKGAIKMDSFSLTRGSDDMPLPSSLSSFTEFDLRNFSLSGSMTLTAPAKEGGESSANYGVSVKREYADTVYNFTYDFKSHYVAGQGLEFTLALTDQNNKASSFAVRGDYLYIDLSAYGVAKCKIKTEELSSRLGVTGFKDVDDYDFRDKLHLLVLLAAGRNEEGDIVRYDLGEEVFDLISQKIGFQGLFGVEGATLSWSKANNRLQDFSASFTFCGMTAALSSSTFTFGTPVELAAVNDALYADLAEKETTHISLSGALRQNTRFETDGELLSAVLSSLAGEQLTFTEAGQLLYTADVVFGKTGAVKNYFTRLYNARGVEIVNLYYTEETPDNFYLIYPEERGSGVRSVRTFTFAEEPFAAFNAALGIQESGVGQRIILTADANAFTIGAHLPVLQTIEDKLSLIYPDFSLSLLTGLNCRRYELRMASDLMTAKVVFDADNDLSFTAESFNVTFGDDWTITSLTAATPERVDLLADNDMPEVATVVFTGGLTYQVSLVNGNNDKIWSYPNVPTGMGRAGQTEDVLASATLLGKEIKAIIKADLSPATAVTLGNSATYGDRYDGDRTFTMEYYNDALPGTILGSFTDLLAEVNDAVYPKKINWDLTGVSTSYDTKDFYVRPKVKTYFGNEIFLGNVAVFTLHVNGEKAVSTEYTKKFVAYDGFDPLDPAVYTDLLKVTTADGTTVEVKHVEWDLTNAFIENQIKYNILYAYTTDPNEPDIVRARVYDSMGEYVPLEVKIYFEARVVGSATFDVSGLDGVTYEQGKGFTFDVLKVRGLNPTRTEGVLPQSFVANKGDPDEWHVSGIKWSFDKVESVLNAAGTTGTLTLTIGDSISGYQEIEYPYAFTGITVTDTALLTANKEPVAGISKVDNSLYSYLGSHLNAYTYTFPAYVRVTYRIGETEDTEDLLVNWSYDKTFDENLLCSGGAYVLTGAVGSEELTVSLSFDQKIITSYDYVDRATMEGNGSLTTHQGKASLTFSVLSALEENGVQYVDAQNYPATLKVAFNGGSEYVTVPVTWDLSAYEGRTDMIGSGYFGKVTAIAKGQRFDVYVYVEPAYDTVYFDAGLTKSDLTFSLMSAGTLGADGKFSLVVTDPRLASNYPTKIYVASDKTIDVVEWLGLDAVTQLYLQNYETTAPNAISGNVIVRAKVGNASIGYKEINVPVHIVESVIDQSAITVSGLPFAASSEMTGGATPYAVTPKYEPFTVGGTQCGFSLDANPYYVNPKAQSTYPAYLVFELDGRPVRAEAKWDLDSIPNDAAAATVSKNYLIWGEISLGDAFKKVKIPVAVTVLKREIDVVWIKDTEGNYINEKYIDIDGYAYEPFGDYVVGDEVMIDVKVQFKGDANRYPLKLKYSKAGVVLSYDGSNLYEHRTVYVGNESGGFRAIEGYTIRILSKILSKVRVKNSGVYQVFFESVYDDVTHKITYNYYSAVDMGAELPSEIKATFGQDGAEITVPIATGNDPNKGLVFRWDRDSNNYLGIVLWNPSVSEAVGGVRQSIYNAKQSNYATPTEGMFFNDLTFTNSVVYRDSANEADAAGPAGYITVSTFLAARDSEILTSTIEKEYQNRYITTEEDPLTKLNVGAVLNVGSYRLYISVEGHEQYSGVVYKSFTVTPKDISSFVCLYVGGGRHDEADPHDKYNGSPFLVSAKVPDYDVDVPLLVDGLDIQEVVNVRYGVGSTAIPYTFTVTAKTGDPIGRNYQVNDTTVSFKVTEASVPAGQTYIHLNWSPSRSTFDVTVKILEGDPLSAFDGEAEDLTEGYIVKYYESIDSTVEITSLTAGNTYYYTVTAKIPNYESVMRLRTEIIAA